MKRFHIIGVSLIAVLAFCAVGVASAGAITTLLAEWLVNGAAVTATTAVTTEGLLLLEDSNALKAGIKAAVECSGILTGTIGVNGADEIAELLSLSGTAISLKSKEGAGLSCTNVSSCEGSKVWAVNLPWKTLLELVENGATTLFVDLIVSGTGGNAGWSVECTDLGVKITDECLAQSEAAAELTNGITGAEGKFTESVRELMGLKKALCSSSGEETGAVISNTAGNTKVASGTLSVSE